MNCNGWMEETYLSFGSGAALVLLGDVGQRDVVGHFEGVGAHQIEALRDVAEHLAHLGVGGDGTEGHKDHDT